jgi:valyl-tRNA synthetase
MEPGQYDHQAVEAAARALWETHDVYRYERDGHGPVFSVDTPPPYVSAAHLHVGHAMSYSQPDFIVRYRRMRGERVFYPIGFDDNGLPTERYVEQAYGVRAVDMPRAEFVALCLAETQRTAERYEDLWRRLGLSLDWSLRYSTIDARCQRTAQTSFVTLHEAGYLRRAQDPILWCPEDQTSLAQADVEDLERTSRLHTIRFGGERDLQIATTRPELLPACVALYHHPADDRYQGLSTARVPLFGYEVPVLTDQDVDPEYGTGLMMVCTFGDSEDVLRWRRDHLALRLVVGPDGRLGELAGPFAGLTVTQGCASGARLRSSSRSGRSGSSRCGRTPTGSGPGRPSWNGSRRSCGAGSKTGSTGSSGTGTSPGSGGMGCRSRSGSAPRATHRCWPASRTCRSTRSPTSRPAKPARRAVTVSSPPTRT